MAWQVISTPVIEVPLEADADQTVARGVKGRIERTTLGQVAGRAALPPCAAAVRIERGARTGSGRARRARGQVASRLLCDRTRVMLLCLSSIAIVPVEFYAHPLLCVS